MSCPIPPRAALRVRVAPCVLLVAACLAACGGVTDDAPAQPAGGLGPLVLLPTDVRVNQGIGDGNARYAQVCAQQNRVYVIWQDTRDGGESVYFNRSTNGGLTWLPTDTRLDTPPPSGTPIATGASMCCDGSLVYVSWGEVVGTRVHLFFDHSADAGLTWRPAPVQVDTATTGLVGVQAQLLACRGNDVYVVWVDDRNGSSSVWFRRSDDRGLTWGPPETRLDVSSPPSQELLLRRQDDSLYAGWTSAGSLICRASHDRGSTWEDERVLNGGPGMYGTIRSSLFATPAHVHATYLEDRSGEFDIYYQRSGDGGFSWRAADLRLNQPVTPHVDVGVPSLCASGDHVLVAWDFDVYTPTTEVRARRSHDGGVSWMPRETVRAPGHSLIVVTAACDTDHVFVIWNDDTLAAPASAFYVAHAGWTGPWTAGSPRLNSPPVGTTTVGSLGVTMDSGQLHAVWSDDRTGMENVYFNRARVGP